MTRTPLTLAAALLLASAVGPGCALSVEGELPAIDITRKDIRIPAIPAEGRRTPEQTVMVPVFVEPHDRLVLPRESYESVKVHNVALTAKSGVSDMSFVRTLRLTISSLEDHSAKQPPLEMARYERGATPDHSPTLTITNDPPTEVVAAWKADVVVIGIEVSGVLPDGAWVLDVTARMSATIRY